MRKMRLTGDIFAESCCAAITTSNSGACGVHLQLAALRP
jgi:hypothetical protein